MGLVIPDSPLSGRRLGVQKVNVKYNIGKKKTNTLIPVSDNESFYIIVTLQHLWPNVWACGYVDGAGKFFGRWEECWQLCEGWGGWRLCGRFWEGEGGE